MEFMFWCGYVLEMALGEIVESLRKCWQLGLFSSLVV